MRKYLLFLASIASSDRCPATSESKLNIHIISHSHDDVGWLKTVDEYYSQNVQYIIDSYTENLLNDKNRKFIQVETAFFARWWRRQSTRTKNDYKKLVSEGRLQFTLGHWSMPDEASTYYRDIITNAELGMRFIEENFNILPKVAWQIDPFGHSRGIAKLYKDMGFEALFLGRVDINQLADFRNHNMSEFSWKFGDYGLDTIINPNVYWPPPNMCWDVLCDDPVIEDDPELKTFNADKVTEDFYDYVMQIFGNYGYKTNNIMITFGNDFNYSGSKWWKNIETLMKHFKSRYGETSEIFYSTPECYHKSLSGKTFKNSFSGDFFPYADFPHAYWTGYFASRPAFKNQVAVYSSLLNVCQQIDLYRGTSNSDYLKEAISISQHHDAVSGTERKHVAQDYKERLEKGVKDCKIFNPNEESYFYNPLAYCRNHEYELNGEMVKVGISALGSVRFGSRGNLCNNRRKRAIEFYHPKIMFKTSIPQAWFYYRPVIDKSEQAAGAYIFRNNGPAMVLEEATEFISQHWSSNGAYDVFSYEIREIPVSAISLEGKEIVSRFFFDVDSIAPEDFELYTDSTNFEFLKRTKKYETMEPIASSFYPVTAQFFVEISGRECIAVTTSHSIGVRKGDKFVELLLARRLLVDDFRGVTEPLDDDQPVKGQLWFSKFTGSCNEYHNFIEMKKLEKEMRNPVTQIWVDNNLSLQAGKNFMKSDLPESFHLLSLYKDSYRKDMVIIRIENLSNQHQWLSFYDYFNISEETKIKQVSLAATMGKRQTFDRILVFKAFEIQTFIFSL